MILENKEDGAFSDRTRVRSIIGQYPDSVLLAVGSALDKDRELKKCAVRGLCLALMFQLVACNFFPSHLSLSSI